MLEEAGTNEQTLNLACNTQEKEYKPHCCGENLGNSHSGQHVHITQLKFTCAPLPWMLHT